MLFSDIILMKNPSQANNLHFNLFKKVDKIITPLQRKRDTIPIMELWVVIQTLMVSKLIWKCELVTVGSWEHMEVFKLILVVEI